MSAQEMERTLARLYTDSDFRGSFLRDANAALSALDLTAGEKTDLAGMDRAGLVMAAASYQHKQERRARGRRDVRNPYAPPSAPVEDPVRAASMDRPRQVVLATVLLWSGLVLGIAKWAFEWRSLGVSFPIYISVPVGMVGFVIRAWLTIKIYAGRNWARVTLLVFALLGLVVLLSTAWRALARSPVSVFGRIGLTALLLTALGLLFSRPASEWFRTRAGSL
jgi:hypothetical protein